MTKLIKLIYSEQFRGMGTDDDPCRTVLQLWTTDGWLIAEQDTHSENTLNLEELRTK